MLHDQAASRARAGILYGVAAYAWWGLIGPVYFKAVGVVPSPEVLAHRIVWSVLLLWVLVVLLGRSREAGAAIRSRRTLLTLAASAALIAVNWYLFIWAVQHNHIAQSSLGYFINPLVNVLMGVVFLRERLRPWQLVSVLLAALGVAWMAVAKGQVPTLALGLAFSFGSYALIRKLAPVEGLVGLTVETTLLFPLAAGYLGWLMLHHRESFLTISTRIDILLACAGVVTSLPLIWFVAGARRLSLATLGFLQYLSPSLQFLLALAMYNEPFGRAEAVSFALIWAALAVFSLDADRARRARRTGTSPSRSTARNGAQSPGVSVPMQEPLA